jgi:hypothetical protein
MERILHFEPEQQELVEKNQKKKTLVLVFNISKSIG